MPGPRVLVVEDDVPVAAGLVRGLQSAGFEVDLSTSGEDVVRIILGRKYDVVVLDLMLPGAHGFSVLEQLKDRSHPPIIVLTARTDLHDRLKSFELGAADYLSKPFFIDELVARIRARTGVVESEPLHLIRFGQVVLNVAAREATVSGVPAGLTPTELDLLVYLTTRPSRAVSRQQLAESILRSLDDAGGRTVDAHVARLRRKLGADASAIATVWGIGYRFDAPTVREGEPPTGEGTARALNGAGPGAHDHDGRGPGEGH